MAHHDIFREQLAIRFPALGHALWEPSPGNLYHAVGVGDVGYISEGRFHRLFNILLPDDDPSHRNFGVPDNHKPFEPKVSEHVVFGTLRPDNFCSAGVTLDSEELGQFATRPRDPGEVSFSCRGKQGAVLSLPVQAKSENTVVRKDFGKWMIEHIDQWFAWTQHKGLEIDRMEDIILVTGADCTGSWANVAFLGGQADARASFNVEVVHSRINWQFSSERKTGAIWNWGPSGENLPEDQCIFIRGFRVARKRLTLRSRLRAASGPNPDLNDEDCEPDAELISIPTVPKYHDPLHVILEYIAEGSPDCDMTIVHDDDLTLIVDNGASLESLRPDVVLSRLRSSKPVIHWHDVVLGPAVSYSDLGAKGDTELVGVASLSATFEGHYSKVSSLQTSIVTSKAPANQLAQLRRNVQKNLRPPNLALSPPPKTTLSMIELDAPIDGLYRHSLYRFAPPTSPIYETPLSTTFTAFSHAEAEAEHLKAPDDISNQLAVLEQLRRNVQKNLRLRPIPVTPSPPRSPTRPVSSASNWSDFTQPRSASPAPSFAFPSVHDTPISDPKSPPLSEHYIGPAAFDRAALETPRSLARAIDATSVISRLDNPIRRPLLIDTRPAAAFLGSHIKSSINFAIPSLILKRSRKPGAGFGSIDALRQFITTEPCRLTWDTLMAPGGPWDGDVIVYDEEMNPQDRLNPQVTAWAFLPVITPLLVRGRADYLEGGILAAHAHPGLKKFITSSDDDSHDTLHVVHEGKYPFLSSIPPPPKLSLLRGPKKAGGLFQLDTATAAHSRTLPEIEFSAGASPVPMLANILPGNTDSSPWNIIDASPSPPPSQSTFPRPSPPRQPSLTALRKLDTKSAERLGPPKLQVRTLRSATLAASPSAGLWPGGGGTSPRAHPPSHPILAHSNHTSPASAKLGEFLHPPPSPNLSASPSTEEAIPTFTVSTILPNFLYLGPEITAEEHVRELQSLGIRRILNMAAECGDYNGLGLRQRFERYVKIPMRDTVEKENIFRCVREACEVLDDASLHSAPVYVHCKAGESRSVTAVIAYLIHANHWTLSRACTFVLERKGPSLNIGSVFELMYFEEAELGSKYVGVAKQPQAAGGNGDTELPDSDAHNRGAAIGKGSQRPSYMPQSLPPAWGTATTNPLPGVGRGVAGVGVQEMPTDGRYRYATRAPVAEITPAEITPQPMRRVSKTGLKSTRRYTLSTGGDPEEGIDSDISKNPRVYC